MRAIDYALREAWGSLWRSGRSTLLAVLAITLAAVVLGAILLVSWNVDQLLTQWTTATEFSVFLRDDATSEQRGAIVRADEDGGGPDVHAASVAAPQPTRVIEVAPDASYIKPEGK